MMDLGAPSQPMVMKPFLQVETRRWVPMTVEACVVKFCQRTLTSQFRFPLRARLIFTVVLLIESFALVVDPGLLPNRTFHIEANLHLPSDS